ncbi:MAG: response regulator transcription factor [Candidatus Nanopelagicales bacterium]
MTPAVPVRVVLADDHPVYRSGLIDLVSTTDDLELVGEADGGQEALDLVASLDPDVLLLDLEMPELDGFDVLRELQESGTAVLVLTMHGDDNSVFEAMKAGARGFVSKSARPQEILDAVRVVADGGVVFSAAVGRRLSNWFFTLQRHHGPLSHLTPREREVLAMMARGRDNASIAALLDISPKTVRNVVSAILTKLQVVDRAAAIAKAREAGLA